MAILSKALVAAIETAEISSTQHIQFWIIILLVRYQGMLIINLPMPITYSLINSTASS
ncbi:hypothetical protein NSP_24250 [Nodularia spumigena CCY9414]|nr:hypothetical protein NSP_24250 [Nodularia spumigena CCY9414]